MAGSKGTKYYDVFLEYKIWLSFKGFELFNEQLLQLLIEIDKHGSIMTASKNLNISYRKAWGDIQIAQTELGVCFVSKQRGGKCGGLTVLTEEGKLITDAYKELKSEFDNAIHNVSKKFFNKINK
jgi:molybdate transport system regulatory protein